MVQITIDDHLAKAIALAGGSVTLVDSRGNKVAQFATTESTEPSPLGMTPEHLAELERRIKEDDGTRIPFDEVIRRVCVPASE